MDNESEILLTWRQWIREKDNTTKWGKWFRENQPIYYPATLCAEELALNPALKDDPEKFQKLLRRIEIRGIKFDLFMKIVDLLVADKQKQKNK